MKSISFDYIHSLMQIDGSLLRFAATHAHYWWYNRCYAGGSVSCIPAGSTPSARCNPSRRQSGRGNVFVRTNSLHLSPSPTPENKNRSTQRAPRHAAQNTTSRSYRTLHFHEYVKREKKYVAVSYSPLVTPTNGGFETKPSLRRFVPIVLDVVSIPFTPCFLSRYSGE